MNPLRSSILLAVSLALAGCARTPPLDRIVKAESPSALSHWRERMGNDLTQAQWDDFDAARGEIELKIKMDPAAKESDAVDAMVCVKISGQTVRQVIQQGFELKLARLDAEGVWLVDFIHKNAATPSGNSLPAGDPLERVYTQVALLDQVDKEIERTSQKLDLLLNRPHVPRKPRQPLP